MHHDLNKQLRRFTGMMMALQLAGILSTMLLFCGFNYFVKLRLIEHIGTEAGRYMINGDLRQAVIFLASTQEDEFDFIRLYDRNHTLLLDYPMKPRPPRIFSINRVLPISGANRAAPHLGELSFTFSVFQNVEIAFLCSLFLMLLTVPYVRHRRRDIQAKYESEIKARTAAAIAGVVQMLAHDVRKPFSMLKMGVDILKEAEDLHSMNETLALLVPEIERAANSVNGLIADVMEVGSTSTSIMREPASPESLIASTLGDTFRIYPQSDISIVYDFHHAHMVNVHVRKIERVFSNIVGNALQAMNYRGLIWFKTRETDGMVEFCLGNAGSLISPESVSKLFDTFFTSGKKSGTGLGLAIAQKVVMAHGGKIWCESRQTAEYPNGKVEFFFTLPIAEGTPYTRASKLPLHSSEVITDIPIMMRSLRR